MLTKQLREATGKKEEIEEELTRYRNQDRVIREKCDVLETKTAKQKQQIDEQDYELLKLQKDIKDLIEEKDKLLGAIHDSEVSKDNLFAELQKARAANTELDEKLLEA